MRQSAPIHLGFPSVSAVISLECRRLRFSLWVWKIPWKRKWQLTPVFLPEESAVYRVIKESNSATNSRNSTHTAKYCAVNFFFFLRYRTICIALLTFQNIPWTGMVARSNDPATLLFFFPIGSLPSKVPAHPWWYQHHSHLVLLLVKPGFPSCP